MSNLDRDLAEMKRLGYTSYGKYKVDHPYTKEDPEKLVEPPKEIKPEKLEVGIGDYVCKCCGKHFESARAGRKFCSTACCRLHAKRQYNLRQRENKAPILVNCPQCGREFIKKRNLRYCSPECRKIAALKSQREYERKRRGKHDDIRL